MSGVATVTASGYRSFPLPGGLPANVLASRPSIEHDTTPAPRSDVPTISAAPAPATRPTPAPTEERGAISRAAIQFSFFAGLGKMGLDMARVAAKFPEARATGNLPTAVRQFITAAPTTSLIDPSAPRLASAALGGKTFTAFDRSAYRLSSGIGAALAGVQLASSVPNLIEGWQKDGPAGLVNSQSGRTGVLQAAGGGFALGLLSKAFVETRAAGTTGFLPTLLEATAKPSLSRPWVAGIGFLTAGLVIANELGFFDFLNKGETRDLGQVMSDAVHNLPFM